MRSRRTAVLALAIFWPGLVLAQPADPPAAGPDRWEAGVEAYLWLGSIGGTSRLGRDLEVPFDELVDNLQLGFMGAVSVGRGEWRGILDGVYVALGNELTLDLPAGREAELRTDIDTLVLGLVGARRVSRWGNGQLELVAGARYLQQTYALTAGVDLGAVAPTRPRIWNAVAGAQLSHDVTDRWALRVYADVGTGETELTWQARASVAYRFGRLAARLGYRHMAWDFGRRDEGSRPFDELSVFGPFLAADYTF